MQKFSDLCLVLKGSLFMDIIKFNKQMFASHWTNKTNKKLVQSKFKVKGRDPVSWNVRRKRSLAPWFCVFPTLNTSDLAAGLECRLHLWCFILVLSIDYALLGVAQYSIPIPIPQPWVFDTETNFFF